MKRLTKIFPVYVLALFVICAPAVIQNWALAEYETCQGKVVEVENPFLRAAAEREEIAKWLNHIDLICPLASVTGPVEIIDCYPAGNTTAFSESQWLSRQYESVRLLVPSQIWGVF